MLVSENQIRPLHAAGLSNAKIAQRLKVSPRTIGNYLRRMGLKSNGKPTKVRHGEPVSLEELLDYSRSIFWTVRKAYPTLDDDDIQHAINRSILRFSKLPREPNWKISMFTKAKQYCIEILRVYGGKHGQKVKLVQSHMDVDRSYTTDHTRKETSRIILRELQELPERERVVLIEWLSNGGDSDRTAKALRIHKTTFARVFSSAMATLKQSRVLRNEYYD